MSEIIIEHKPDQQRLQQLHVASWSIWTKEISEFPWTYDAEETCYFLEGEVTVTPTGGKPVRIGVHDLVIFPAGMSCTWKIIKPVKKHYQFA